MADQTFRLTGSAASDVYVGLMETGKFVRLRTYGVAPTNSRLYGTTDDAFMAKAFPKHEAGIISGIHAYAENPTKRPGKDDDRDDEPNKDSDSGRLCTEYVLRVSVGIASVVLEILKNCPDSFQLENMEEPAHTLVRCFGSHERTAEVLREIRKAI